MGIMENTMETTIVYCSDMGDYWGLPFGICAFS